MLASLPMYDLPVVRAATDAWWAGLARHLRAAGVREVPDTLQREPAPAWTDPRLLLSQTCGYPLTHALAGRVSLVGTPCYDAPGCEGPRYASALVVAAAADARELADLRGGVCACNQRESHSGYNVLRRLVAPLADGTDFFANVVETGSHAASIAVVAEGRADLCAVDAVVHALLSRQAPEALARTRVLGFSPTAPGLPCIAGPRVAPDTVARMRDAIEAAVSDPGLAAARAELRISGFAALEPADYDEIATMEREAGVMGYPQLR